ncbi:MAG TPA: ATP-binding protein [Saprospiraceae bacterium]|nr:ATP-binding protein [Saprospiraceae bacterium]
MIKRDAEKKVRLYARQFRALAIVGPRQSGKTTLAKQVFPRKPYVSLEDPDERSMALEDPRFFLSRFKNGAIIDEVQRAPDLFSYLQSILDVSKRNALFVLTGSNNFLLNQSISQSLAGRIGYIDLLPLTITEISRFTREISDPDRWMLQGGYPEVFDRKRDPVIWYPAYIRTYVERDVRMIKNIVNTSLFTKFLRICAGRTSQLINLSAISIECGIELKTVQSWLAVLESSYIIFMLKPHHANFNKRLVKSPKLYFYDTGLACSLLGITTSRELSLSPFRGALFENAVVSEKLKIENNKTRGSLVFFWRDNKGIEVDLLMDDGQEVTIAEIKSGATFNNAFLKNLNYWNQLSGQQGGELIYGGDKSHPLPGKNKLVSWKDLH